MPIVSNPRLNAWWAHARGLVGLTRVAADNRSRRRLLALRLGYESSNGGVVAVRVRGLESWPVRLRPGTADILAFIDDFVDESHLPPPELRDEPLASIWELGSNVGYGLVTLARRYPSATIVGVEPDPGNVALARENAAPFTDRCTVVHAAAWDEDTELVVFGEQSHGLGVRPRRPDDDPALEGIPALSVSSLLERYGPEGMVDYMLVEVERSEQRLLTRGTDWAERVRSIRVEVYSDGSYTGDDTVRDLRRLGFHAWLEPSVWGGYALGVRRGAG